MSFLRRLCKKRGFLAAYLSGYKDTIDAFSNGKEYQRYLMTKHLSSEEWIRLTGEGRAEMYQHFIAMFEPRGVVDIAFKTDENLRSI